MPSPVIVSTTTSSICSTVLILPLMPAAMTCPCSTAHSRRPETTNSRAMKMMQAVTFSRPMAVSMINAVCVSSLSAIGSMNLPKLVIRLRERAMRPSSISVSEAATNTSSGQICIDLSLSKNHSSTKYSGTIATRSSVSLLGRFIARIARPVCFSVSTNFFIRAHPSGHTPSRP